MTRGAEIYVRQLGAKFAKFKDILQRFYSALVSEDIGVKQKISVALLKEIEGLQEMLPESDQPTWLKGLGNYIRKYNDKNGYRQILDRFFQIYSEIEQHNWSYILNDENDPGLDFEELYEQYRNESRVSELIDKLIAILEKIIVSEKIYDLRIIETLDNLKSTLLKNRTGSIFSLVGNMYFLKQVLKCTFWGVLEETKGLGPLVKSLRKNADEFYIATESISKNAEKVFDQEISPSLKQVEGLEGLLSQKALSSGENPETE